MILNRTIFDVANNNRRIYFGPFAQGDVLIKALIHATYNGATGPLEVGMALFQRSPEVDTEAAFLASGQSLICSEFLGGFAGIVPSIRVPIENSNAANTVQVCTQLEIPLRRVFELGYSVLGFNLYSVVGAMITVQVEAIPAAAGWKGFSAC